jgi:TatD DNase family protein
MSRTAMIIDSHCHLDFPDFERDRDDVVARARAAGLARMITISTRIDKVEQVRAIAEAYDDVFFTIGTHPHQAHLDPETPVERIVDLARHPKCVGIGEAGLDYHYDQAPRDVAARVFRTHIAAARLALDLGLSISFSGVLTFKKSEDLRAIAADVPLDRLLVETDAPFLAPTPFRGKRNEPAYVVETARTLAEVKGVGYDEIAASTTANVLRLFDKMPAPLRQAA